MSQARSVFGKKANAGVVKLTSACWGVGREPHVVPKQREMAYFSGSLNVFQ